MTFLKRFPLIGLLITSAFAWQPGATPAGTLVITSNVSLAWSNLARQDLEESRRYSVERWGAAVACAYLGDIRDAAKAVAERPERNRVLWAR
jgi:hypothetical protein